MPKQKLGTGNKRAVLQRPGTSYTSPNAIKLQQRRATALDYRLQGHPFWKIGKALNCHPSTAQSYVVRAMKDLLPVEKREAVLQMELQRLDMMQAAVYRNAEDGLGFSILSAWFVRFDQKASAARAGIGDPTGVAHATALCGIAPIAPNASIIVAHICCA